MIKERIIEKTGRKANKDLSAWYKNKVAELASLLIKNLNEQPAEFSESYKEEVLVS